MELNCRPQFGLFQLKLLKIWVIFKYIYLLTRIDTWYGYFRKNMSNIPGDNGSSLNKLKTLQIIALADITLIETSVSVVYP
jgi:hypothetical protein